MELSRRALLTSAALAVPATTLAAPASATGSGRTPALAALHTFMAEQGFTQIPPLPLTGGPSATDGYNYDEGMTRADWRNRRYVVQPCARVDDIGERKRRGVLPTFSQGAWQTNPGKALPLAVDFLIEAVGLRREALALTTIRGNPLLPYVEKAGFTPRQVRLRSTAAAKRAGDGSGWFVDRSTGQGCPSLSIEYTRGSHTLEIAELGTCEGLPGKPVHTVFGLERLDWAVTGTIATWDEVLPRLLAYSRAAHKNSGAPMPSGYAKFKASR